jgi:hypothetical protein
MASRSSIRREVERILRMMPPGTKVRRKKDGTEYIVGVPFRMTDVWIMQPQAGKKGLIGKTTLAREFEVVP